MDVAMELLGMALITIVVIIFFAIMLGVAVIIRGFLFVVVVAAPILDIGSLTWLVSKREEKSLSAPPDTAATQGMEPTYRDSQTGEPTWAAQPQNLQRATRPVAHPCGPLRPDLAASLPDCLGRRRAALGPGGHGAGEDSQQAPRQSARPCLQRPTTTALRAELAAQCRQDNQTERMLQRPYNAPGTCFRPKLGHSAPLSRRRQPPATTGHPSPITRRETTPPVPVVHTSATVNNVGTWSVLASPPATAPQLFPECTNQPQPQRP